MQARSGGAMRHEYTLPVSARMGFVPIPLLCLVVRVVGHDVWPMLNLRHPSGWLLCFLIWVTLCALKLLTTITLVGFACHRTVHSATDAVDPNAQDVGKLNLAGIDRYTLYGKRIF
jgi:hypothetical protein